MIPAHLAPLTPVMLKHLAEMTATELFIESRKFTYATKMHFNLGNPDIAGNSARLAIHLMKESKKHAYAS